MVVYGFFIYFTGNCLYLILQEGYIICEGGFILLRFIGYMIDLLEPVDDGPLPANQEGLVYNLFYVYLGVDISIVKLPLLSPWIRVICISSSLGWLWPL